MPMSATTRPFGMGPIDDPGALGWDALGQGVHFSLGNGAAGSLLGDYPLATRNTMLHSTDSLAGFDAASTAEQAKKNAAAGSSADAYMNSLMSGAGSPGDETRMMAAMNPWERAAWTGQGNPGNFIRKGNTIVPRYNESQLAANPGLVSGHGTAGPSLASRLGISGQGTAAGTGAAHSNLWQDKPVGGAGDLANPPNRGYDTGVAYGLGGPGTPYVPGQMSPDFQLAPGTEANNIYSSSYSPDPAPSLNATIAARHYSQQGSPLNWTPPQGPAAPKPNTFTGASPAQRMNVMPWDTPNLASIYGLGKRATSFAKP